MSRKAPSKKQLKAKADTLMSLFVRSRGYCELQMSKGCTPRSNLQHHHVVEKARCNALRYDHLNALCVCSACHQAWHHAGVIAAGDFFIKKFGQKRWDYLASNTQKTIVTNNRFYLEVIEELSKKSLTT